MAIIILTVLIIMSSLAKMVADQTQSLNKAK